MVSHGMVVDVVLIIIDRLLIAGVFFLLVYVGILYNMYKMK